MKQISAEAYSKIGLQYIGMPYDKMDCQEFIEQCMRDLGLNRDLAGSNAWYREMTWVGSPEECKKKFGCIPNGALLYILEQDGNEPDKYKPDGIGNASHIGIKTGKGDAAFQLEGAIHSSKTKGMVCQSKFDDKTINGGWNRVGLWNRFDYGEKINRLLNGEQPAEEEETVLYFAIVDSENDKGVNFRKEKDTSKGYIATIPEGTELPVYEDDGTWSRVMYKNQEGYVMSKYLRTIDMDNGKVEIDCEQAMQMYEILKAALGL